LTREEKRMSATPDDAVLTDLAGHASGSVFGPQDAGSEAARAVRNSLIDRKPPLIVRCGTMNGVVVALTFARGAGLEVSIRGCGYNVAGRAVTHGEMTIDLAEMKGIAVHPYVRALARCGGGDRS
jgi:FAD/FMN-containing dehydrogenase